MTDASDIASMNRVTDLHRAPQGADPRDAAVQAADAAAAAAGVRIRQIAELDGLRAVHRLYDEIWRPDPNNPPVTTELLRALTKSGNYVAGAYDGDRLLGACVGFFGGSAGRELHSHIAGVSRQALGRNVGFALKLHQRAWAMLHELAAISWTFDPLVSRNAYFNVAKLAAAPTEYLTNFYGGMHDSINGSDDSDRLLIRWDLGAPQVAAACTGTPRRCDAKAELAGGAVIGLSRSGTGTPVVGTLDAASVLVAVPPDIERLRSVDPACARQWRLALREVLGHAMADGARVVGFDRAGWYLAVRPTRPDTPASAPVTPEGAR
jgi:predicted GNAT superfamily acetyltransferase